MTGENTDLGLFAGSHRARKYDEPIPVPSEEAPEAPPGEAPALVIRDESPEAPGPPEHPVPVPTQEAAPATVPAEWDLLPTRARPEPVAPGLLQRVLIRVGVAQAPPSAEELADAENERVIRQSTWTRAMSAVVVNPKGGSMKTPLTLLLAGAIAQIRGGGVAAWEATEVPGDLAAIAEGDPPRGLTELIAASEMVTSAGNLAGYSAPQTSHAAVFGSVSSRDELTPQEVRSLRSLLGTYYQVEIADTANNLQRPSLREVLAGADAVVIPCVSNYKSVRGLQRALTAVESVPGLSDRVILAVSHDGGPENAEFSSALMDTLARHYRVRGIVNIPFDPAIRAEGELSYGSLQPGTRQAVRTIARMVVEAFNAAPITKTESE